MSKYSGLDKVDLTGLSLVEKYAGGKIYLDDDGYKVVKRGYEIDSCLNTVEGARGVLDHFNLD